MTAREPVLDVADLARLEPLGHGERLVLRARATRTMTSPGAIAAQREAPVGAGLDRRRPCDSTVAPATGERVPALDDPPLEHDGRLHGSGRLRALQHELVPVGDLDRGGHAVDLGGAEAELRDGVERRGPEAGVRPGIHHLGLADRRRPRR